ncbi:hypothetical protein PanWU01x14_125330 [Parasponia andersonii]|uniref:Uncharacterized protein n=1 Tax=Parasponia andersonii TaxID=3476 RepID=A0A2P5CT44_PARAD|nr:hypothetical protein PanWU01x14_125330 [Parasponia andersonii]
MSIIRSIGLPSVRISVEVILKFQTFNVLLMPSSTKKKSIGTYMQEFNGWRPEKTAQILFIHVPLPGAN